MREPLTYAEEVFIEEIAFFCHNIVISTAKIRIDNMEASREKSDDD